MNFITNWTHSIYDNFFSNIDTDEATKEKIIFSMEVLLSEITKMLILISTFSFMNRAIDIILILLFSVPLRIHLGGFHMKKYAHCLLFSFFYCLSVERLAYFIHLNQYTLIILSLMCLIIITAIAPVIPVERSQIKSISSFKLKIKAIIITIFYISIYLLWPNSYTLYTQWIIIIQTLIILIYKGDVFYERKIANSHQ